VRGSATLTGGEPVTLRWNALELRCGRAVRCSTLDMSCIKIAEKVGLQASINRPMLGFYIQLVFLQLRSSQRGPGIARVMLRHPQTLNQTYIFLSSSDSPAARRSKSEARIEKDPRTIITPLSKQHNVTDVIVTFD